MFCVIVLFPVIVYSHICKHNYLLHKHCMNVLLRAFTNSRSIMSVLGVCTRTYRHSTLIVRVCALSVHIRIHHAPTLCVCVFYARMCIGNALTHTQCVCAPPIHTRTYTTQTKCVLVVYARVCIGYALKHSRWACVHHLYIHVNTPRTHMECVRGVCTCCIGNAHTRSMCVCVHYLYIHEHTPCTHTHGVCVCMVYVCVCVFSCIHHAHIHIVYVCMAYA